MQSDDVRDRPKQILGVSFNRQISLGNMVTLGGSLLGTFAAIITGVWILSGQYASSITRLADLELRLEQMHVQRDREIDEMKKRQDDEARQRDRLANDIREDVARLNLRFDEWLRQRRGDVQLPGDSAVQ